MMEVFWENNYQFLAAIFAKKAMSEISDRVLIPPL